MIVRFCRNLALMAAALVLMAACASLGTPQPQTLNQRVAVTVTAVTAVRQSTATLVAAGKISPADAEHIQQQADNVIAGAQIARSLAPVDPAAADAKLQQTRAVLIALQAYLTARETK